MQVSPKKVRNVVSFEGTDGVSPNFIRKKAFLLKNPTISYRGIKLFHFKLCAAEKKTLFRGVGRNYDGYVKFFYQRNKTLD